MNRLAKCLVFALVLATTICQLSACPMAPDQNWTFSLGKATFGLLGFDDTTYICYGFGALPVPVNPYVTVVISAGIAMAGVGISLFACHSHRKEGLNR